MKDYTVYFYIDTVALKTDVVAINDYDAASKVVEKMKDKGRYDPDKNIITFVKYVINKKQDVVNDEVVEYLMNMFGMKK